MNKGFTIITTPEEERDGYRFCSDCGSKLIVVTAMDEWTVDEEPFKSGEQSPEEIDDLVYITEVSGHYCMKCEVLTSLTYVHF